MKRNVFRRNKKTCNRLFFLTQPLRITYCFFFNINNRKNIIYLGHVVQAVKEGHCWRSSLSGNSNYL